jgi:16S rRNA processing protein RimM
MEPDYVEIGKILKPHGLRGQVKVLSYAASIERFSKGKEIYLTREKGKHPFIVSEAKGSGNTFIIKLQGWDNRQAAEALTGSSLYVRKEALKELPKGEFYWIQLIGSRVFDEQSRCIGILEHIFSTPAHDIWVVKSGLKEFFVPAVEEYIASVNQDQKEIRLRAIHGLDQVNDL